MTRITGIVFICAIVIVGCGGSEGPSDQTQIRDRLAALADAVDQKSPAAACDQLSPNVKEKHSKQYGECPTILGRILVDANSKSVDELRIDVGEITIEGDRATAEVGGEIYPMEKVDGEWYVGE